MMGRADYLALGDYNAICAECGKKFKASMLQKHWQGHYVCERCWEPRHPQDFVRALPDGQTPPWTQRPADVFVRGCTPNSITAIAGFATASCVIAGYDHPAFDSAVIHF